MVSLHSRPSSRPLHSVIFGFLSISNKLVSILGFVSRFSWGKCQHRLTLTLTLTLALALTLTRQDGICFV